MMIKVGYVSLKVQRESISGILDAISNLPLEGNQIKPMDLHMTLMYDKSNPVPLSNVKWFGKPHVEHEGDITGISMLGDEGSQYRAVVLDVSSDTIRKRFDELSMVMTHNFEDHIQHVSLVYGATERDYDLILAALSDILPPNGNPTIRLYGENFSEVKKSSE